VVDYEHVCEFCAARLYCPKQIYVRAKKVRHVQYRRLFLNLFQSIVVYKPRPKKPPRPPGCRRTQNPAPVNFFHIASFLKVSVIKPYRILELYFIQDYIGK